MKAPITAWMGFVWMSMMHAGPSFSQPSQNEPAKQEIADAYRSKTGEGGTFFPHVQWERWRIREIRGCSGGNGIVSVIWYSAQEPFFLKRRVECPYRAPGDDTSTITRPIGTADVALIKPTAPKRETELREDCLLRIEASTLIDRMRLGLNLPQVDRTAPFVEPWAAPTCRCHRHGVTPRGSTTRLGLI